MMTKQLSLQVTYGLVALLFVSATALAKGPKPPPKAPKIETAKDPNIKGSTPKGIEVPEGLIRYVGPDGKVKYITEAENFRIQGVNLRKALGDTHTEGGTKEGTRSVVTTPGKELIVPSFGPKGPQGMNDLSAPKPIDLSASGKSVKISEDYARRPIESIGKESEALVQAAIRDISIEIKTRGKRGKLTPEEEAELREILVELTDTLKAQQDLAGRGKESNEKAVVEKLKLAAIEIMNQKAKLVEAAAKKGIPADDALIKDLFKNQMATFAGIPYHSPSGKGSTEVGIDAFITQLKTLEGDRLVGLAKWYQVYGEAYREARSNGLSVPDAHLAAAKSRKDFIAARAKKVKEEDTANKKPEELKDPEKLLAAICECDHSCKTK